MFSIRNFSNSNYITLMRKKFKQISNKPSFMKHNGGLLLREISKRKFEFKTKVKKSHLNKAGITHGGYICTIIDAGSGTGTHISSGKKPCVTISLDVKFVGATILGDEIKGFVEILKVTKSMVFLNCKLKSKNRIIATALGVWKILNRPLPNAGLGG